MIYKRAAVTDGFIYYRRRKISGRCRRRDVRAQKRRLSVVLSSDKGRARRNTGHACAHTSYFSVALGRTILTRTFFNRIPQRTADDLANDAIYPAESCRDWSCVTTYGRVGDSYETPIEFDFDLRDMSDEFRFEPMFKKKKNKTARKRKRSVIFFQRACLCSYLVRASFVRCATTDQLNTASNTRFKRVE